MSSIDPDKLLPAMVEAVGREVAGLNTVLTDEAYEECVRREGNRRRKVIAAALNAWLADDAAIERAYDAYEKHIDGQMVQGGSVNGLAAMHAAIIASLTEPKR
jgi:hypothetical protein